MGTLEDARMPSLRDKQIAEVKVEAKKKGRSKLSDKKKK